MGYTLSFRSLGASVFCVFLAWLALAPLAAFAEAEADAQAQTAQALVSAEILDHGIFAGSLDEKTGQVRSARLIKSTETIPPTPGTLFGIRYSVSAPEDIAEVRLTIRLQHPPLTDPEDGDALSSYTLERMATPDTPYVQLQRLPQAAPPGEYTFTLLFRGAELATQRFTLQAQPSGFALLQGALQERCRSLESELEAAFAGATLLQEHTFALRLPPGGGIPETGDACFLALRKGNAAALALSDMQGRLCCTIQPPEEGLEILAVSFTQLDADALPEIVVVASREDSDTPGQPQPDSRVYLGFRTEEGKPAWTRRPDLDQNIAHLQNARAVRRWLARNARLPERGHGETVDAGKDGQTEQDPQNQQ